MLLDFTDRNVRVFFSLHRSSKAIASLCQCYSDQIDLHEYLTMSATSFPPDASDEYKLTLRAIFMFNKLMHTQTLVCSSSVMENESRRTNAITFDPT
jgi:hypothetical protein